MEWTIPSTRRWRVVPIIVSEPSLRLLQDTQGLAADYPEGLSSNLGNFSKNVAILSHKQFMGLTRYYFSTPR